MTREARLGLGRREISCRPRIGPRKLGGLCFRKRALSAGRRAHFAGYLALCMYSPQRTHGHRHAVLSLGPHPAVGASDSIEDRLDGHDELARPLGHGQHPKTRQSQQRLDQTVIVASQTPSFSD